MESLRRLATFLFVFAVVGSSVAVARASFIVQTHSIQITEPKSIRGTYDSAIANFGVPQYGGTLTGVIVYLQNNKAGCTKLSKSEAFKKGVGQRPTILMVDRGDCYFSQKVWYAQLGGASAVLVADTDTESLVTMEAPVDDQDTDSYVNNITIPSALIEKATGDKIRSALSSGNMVLVDLDWRETLPHPDERVEYELWGTSNDICGPKCNDLTNFLDKFKGLAITLEQGGYTLFTPHYITWYCPPDEVDSIACKNQCIHKGRYCAPDPESDFEEGYDGKDVLVENLRQLCVWKWANDTGKPWVWWDYVTDFRKRCSMADKMFNAVCAETVLTSLGIDVRTVRTCVGDPTQDVDNPLLQQQEDAQVGKNGRSDVTIQPTLVINNKQYRGKLDPMGVLRAVCSGFEEATEPPVCLGADVQTNECATNNGGCWSGYNVTACKDTFRGRVCQCPSDPVSGVNYVGDGYKKCSPQGVGRCRVNHGGCWNAEHSGQTFSACDDTSVFGTGCSCPSGFTGDGYTCTDVDECAADSTVCKCPDCHCSNTFGSFDCSCPGGLLYMRDSDTCINGGFTSHMFGKILAIVVAALILAALISFGIYKYRLRAYMDSEIRTIMAQYMPLDSQQQDGATRESLVQSA
ncbi:unnamed protein product [Closterium sp. NIES-64]|nr:unnamed protein product [Closterium sp. NIES-64]CAI5955483.1 unnamed protein product [Closterium sp. NIES-65]